MKNFSKVEENNSAFAARELSKAKLYVAYINKAMIDSPAVEEEYYDYDDERSYKASVFSTSAEPGFGNQTPLILSREEEALLYDKYY